MNAKMRAMGLALVAMFALSALVASAASANPKLTPENESSYPVTLKGHEKEGVANEFSLEGGRTVKCQVATLEGIVANKAEAEESKGKVIPVLESCTATILGSTDPVTVTENSCYLLVTSVETTSGSIAAEGWEVTGSAHLQCAAPGDRAEFHVYANATKHAENKPLCTYAIEPQTPSGSLDGKLIEKNAGGYGTVGVGKSTVTGVAVSRVSGTETNCGSPSQNAILNGEGVGEAFNAGGEMIRGKIED